MYDVNVQVMFYAGVGHAICSSHDLFKQRINAFYSFLRCLCMYIYNLSDTTTNLYPV